jgi:hypothetical protein
MAAKREALLKPKVVGEFLREYDGAAMPPDTIAKNVLEAKGVPPERLEGVLDLIVEGAKSVGFIREWGNGRRTVDLAGPLPTGGLVEQQAHPAANGQPRVTPTPTATPQAGVSVAPGVNINIEIHIAADASSETIQEIFKNMRRYVLSGAQDDDNSTSV